jgi:DNA-binding NtrC family response regulator
MRATTVTVLAMLPRLEDQTALKQIFSHSNWNLRLADALHTARPLIDELPAGVVISDRQLPDGRWQDVLVELQGRRIEPVLIVASHLADDGLWAEVLNLGGYDVLATPLEAPEVIRSVSLAWRHWQDRLALAGRPAWKTMAAGVPACP